MIKHRGWMSILFASAVSLAVGVTAVAASVSTYGVEDVSGKTKWIEPQGLWMNPSGELTIVDSGSHTIHSFNKDQQEVLKVGGNRGIDSYGIPIGGYADFDIKSALFDQPNDVVIDTLGTIYISDSNNHTIRKIVNGVVYTHAGTGEQGYQDGKKTKAQFNHPTGLALDADNNLYVADTINHVIRKITPEGNVSTVAGKYFSNGGYLNGTVKEARFNEPSAIVFDELGNLYVSDSGNHIIRYVSENEVSTFAGAVTKIDPTNGYREGGYRNGKKDQSQFNFPKGLHYEKGVLFIADSLNHRIRAITPQGITINVAGLGSAGDALGEVHEAQFNTPTAITYFNGDLYVSDSANHKVKMISIDLKNLKGVQSNTDIIEATPLLAKGKHTQVWFDHSPIIFSEDVKPFRKNGKTYVPIRVLFEQWGAEVQWVSKTQEIKITKGNWMFNYKPTEPSTTLIKGRRYIEESYLQKITGFRFIKVEDFDALIMLSDK